MVDKDPRLITVRRSTVVRAGVVALVVVALGVGIAVGLLVGSNSSPPTESTSASSTTTSHPHTTTTSTPETTTSAAQPVVLSCGPGSTQHVQPATLTVGCSGGTTTVTGITWSAWASDTGGQGTGTLNVGFFSAPAIVVVFHVVNGVFQDVAVTPTKDLTSSPTTSTTSRTILSTTTTTAGIAPVAASQPGTGWGGK